MYREKIEELIKWKQSKNKKPLIIRGARQVGKTWLMKEFGNKYYEDVAYIHFDNNERMEQLFEKSLTPEILIEGLELETGVKIKKGKTLLIFDEVQEVPRALTSLKYFQEEAPEYDIIAAGSLLGIALHDGTSFPVGKVDFMDLYPLNFNEFLLAMGENKLVELIEKNNLELIQIFKSKYIENLKKYYYVGGMPEVVNEFIQNKDYEQVREIQQKILFSYEQDFSKHAPNNQVPRIRMLWNNIPLQLAKENKKFIYGLIRDGARAREYELSLMWLIDCGLVHKVSRISKPNIPLAVYQDFNAFKLFVVDIGILGAMSGIDAKSILEGNKIFTEFKGALTEQYVMQQLIGKKNIDLYYWSAEKGTAELDFLIQLGGKIIPIEVKAEENLQAKSLKSFSEKYKNKYCVRTSMADYRKEEWLTNIPLYLIANIETLYNMNQKNERN